MKQISVIIPNYNAGKYIQKCLDSLLEQEYSVNEIIIVDDYSTDDSKEIIKKYVDKYNKIVYLQNEANKGVSFSRNRGIEHAKFEYIMFCDSDDWYEKHATKMMMEYVEKYQADFVFAGHYITNAKGDKIEIKYDSLFKDTVIDKKSCIAYLPITSSAKLIKKSILLEHNLKYPEGIKNCEELPVIPVAAFFAEKVAYINECLYNYYQRDTSASNRRITDLSFYDVTYDRFCEKLPSDYIQDINIRMVEHLLYSKTFSLIKENFPNKMIIENIRRCKKDLNGQKSSIILRAFPLRKRVFIRCALLEMILPLKFYVKLQQKILKETK